MPHHNENLAALIGSRICHDLISPIGAVSNGLELMALSGAPKGPEMSLVTDSAASAAARIKLLRLAFGIASEEQSTRAEDITTAWSGIHPAGRVQLDWDGPDTVLRPMARAIVLACLCAETALPMGGRLRISQDDDHWRIVSTGSRIQVDQALWDIVTGLSATASVLPAHVQFVLLPTHLAELGRRCDYQASSSELTLQF